MDFDRYWNSVTGRILLILIGIVVIWVGVGVTKPLGYVLEAIGLVVILAAVVNINRVGRRGDPKL